MFRRAFLVLPLLGLASCASNRSVQPLVDPVENEIIVAREGAKALDARIAVDVGTLEIHAGACPLMKAIARYDAGAFEPRVDYWVDDDFRGKLDVSAAVSDASRYSHWSVCLSDALPTSLSVSHDAGTTELYLGNLQLDALDVNLDAGEATIDLVGRRYRNTEAKLRIRGETGTVKLRVPKAVGVRVNVEQDVGNVTTSLSKTADGYVNEAYGATPVQLEIDVSLEVGELEIVTG